MTRQVELVFTSLLAAPRSDVWARVTSQEGVDHEFRPWIRMRFPAPYRDGRIDDLPVGEPVGRAWLLLGGLIPFDYDDLCLVEVEPGSHFLERSTLASATSWEHERRLQGIGGVDGVGTLLTDRLRFQPRVGATKAASRTVVRRVFEHRHRRLRAWFGTGAESS